jgi:pyridoxal phosphate enzyme (YggS family)
LINSEAYLRLKKELDAKQVSLIAVSKTKPPGDILALYELGQRDFGENYVQEMLEKQSQLPVDIRWHFIGHLQTNKVKLIIPFVQLIHGVDSLKLLKEINKQAEKAGKVLDCLLQVHIAKEETKFGLDEKELDEVWDQRSVHSDVSVKGLMGMASLGQGVAKERLEFNGLRRMFERYRELDNNC